MTEDRIRRAQEEISFLPDKTEYVLDTGEFRDINARLARLIIENVHPVLHRRDPGKDSQQTGNMLRRGGLIP